MKKTSIQRILILATIFVTSCVAPQYPLASKKNFKRDGVKKENLFQMNFHLKSSYSLRLKKVSFVNEKGVAVPVEKARVQIQNGTLYENIENILYTVDPHKVGSLKYIYRDKDGYDNMYISFDSRATPLPFRITSKDQKIFTLRVSERIVVEGKSYPVIWIEDENGYIREAWVVLNYDPPYMLTYEHILEEKNKVIDAQGDPVKN